MAELPVFESFYSIQGEGKNTGMAAYFIRLAGCNVGCSFCDEKKAWQKQNSILLGTQEIIARIQEFDAENIIVTGGEPTLYDLTELTSELHNIGKKTFLETSGTNNITGYWDWVTLSPKQNLLPVEESLQKADEIKVVIAKEEDFSFAVSIREQKERLSSKDNCQIQYYLQPEFSQMQKTLALITEYIKQNPVWRLSLQTHKLINVR